MVLIIVSFDAMREVTLSLNDSSSCGSAGDNLDFKFSNSDIGKNAFKYEMN